MRMFLEAATGPPTIVLTAALVVLVCFWLLVAVRVAASDSFDADADLGPWGMGGVPVAVALSLLTVLAWLLSVGATSVLAAFMPPDPATGLLRLTVPVVALLVAWRLTCLFVRPLHRLFPDEPGPSPLGVSDRTAPRGAGDESRNAVRRAPHDGALRTHSRAA
ncbi:MULTISPECIES: hypothetical protein [Streptomyces]|uniref:hypothetical protein n=1 Tax=Streptomyces TaxID=1883 RepID=UPI001E47D1C0|nr:MULTISPECIES: hypothetical protein [Streptomyces]